jgi:hypothetical protein
VPVPPIPVARELTPDPDLTPPAGFIVLEEPLVDGLPHRVPLGADLVGVLTVPTGLALTWRDADPSEPVSRSGNQLVPAAGTGGGSTGAVDRPPVRLFVLRGDQILGALPLVVGRRGRIGDNGLAPGVQLEVVALAWELRVGTLRGPGDAGARLALAWRRVDAAADAFAAPPIHPRVRARGTLTPPEAVQ